jgi:sugar lactone lactonase YvrE
LPIQRVHDFVIDAHGRIAFVNENALTTSLARVDASGKTCGTLSLDAIKGEGNSKLLFACVGGERFVLINSTSAHGNSAGSAWWADFTTGKTTAITTFDRSHVGYVAGFPDGRFSVGAWNCDDGFTAFDAQGRRVWSQRSDPSAIVRTLMRQSPKALTVTTTGEVVALEIDSKSVYRFDQNGRHLGTIDLAKAWGREPNDPTGIEADKAGGFIISDSKGSPPVVRMNAKGSVRAAFQPRHPDGRATGTNVKAAPDGRLWTCDGRALLRLNDAGVVDRVLSDPPDPAQLERISALVVDPTGRIYAADWRTGAIHVFNRRGQFLRTCVPSPTDLERNFGDQLTVSGDGHVYLGLGDLVNNRVGQYVHFLPDGTRQGIETLALDDIRQDWYLQPDTANRWVVTYHQVLLVDRAGTILKRIDRCPDRKWLEHPREASVAPDGSLAVVARGAVNLYGATGDPIRTIPLPANFEGSYAPVAYNGKWVALLDKSGVILFDLSGQKWQQFSLRSALVNVHFGCRLALTPDDRELLLHDGGSTIVRFELPRA